MKSFLHEVSEYILSGNDDLRDINIIVPNRRTGLFLKKNLSELTEKTIWLPKITPIQEIFYDNSSMNIAEEIILIYRLYRNFIKHTGSSETFDDFYYWGEIILADFDDIDKYLVDAEKLFSTISDIKEIDQKFDGYEEDAIEIIKKFWHNVNQAQISAHKQSFLDLWQSMHSIYSDFNDDLKSSNIAYQGMIYREVAEKLEKCNFNSKKYLIVGFNALNKCEKKLFKYLKSNYDVKFFWDADNYYVKDKYQEAGRFIRENIKYYPPTDGYGVVDNINTVKKDIEVIMAPSAISQTKLIPQILAEWQKHDDFKPEKTAIVLGDENLLIPLMYSIPPSIETYNISMGFPVKNSMSAAFISHIIKLQQNYRKDNNEIKFYFKDVLAILDHSFIKTCDYEASKELKSTISTNKLIYITESELGKSQLLKLIFTNHNDKVEDLSAFLTEISNEILERISSMENFVIETEILNKILLRLNALNDCITYDNIKFETDKVFTRLVSNSIKSLNVAFEGEPLEGLQILGFLETRSLDFDRVIMLSINEGVFPKTSVAQSLIPYNLRKFHELPSIEFQDSIFAYYFYRLLQRSKDVKIIHCAQSGDGSSEASRFISQIKYELKQDIKFNSKAYKIEIDSEKINLGQKTEKVLIKVKDHIIRGISPKAINEYLNCHFKYYLSYIENIKEPDKIEEVEDSAFFGTIFHEVMQILYSPFINKKLEKHDFKNITKEVIEESLNQALANVLRTSSEFEITNFKKKIIVDIVLRYVNQLLDYDRQQAPIEILALEESAKYQLRLDNHDMIALIKGNIDRVDLHQKIYRVFDYKTGKVYASFSSVDDLFKSDRPSDKNIITQVLLYSLMFKSDKDIAVCPGIINVNSLNKDFDYRLKYNRKIINQLESNLEEEFKEHLRDLFNEMLNKDVFFTQTENLKNCDYCPYKNICNR